MRKTSEGIQNIEMTILVNKRCEQLIKDMMLSFTESENQDPRLWCGDMLESYLDMNEDSVIEIVNYPKEEGWGVTEYGMKKYISK